MTEIPEMFSVKIAYAVSTDLLVEGQTLTPCVVSLGRRCRLDRLVGRRSDNLPHVQFRKQLTPCAVRLDWIPDQFKRPAKQCAHGRRANTYTVCSFTWTGIPSRPTCLVEGQTTYTMCSFANNLHRVQFSIGLDFLISPNGQPNSALVRAKVIAR